MRFQEDYRAALLGKELRVHGSMTLRCIQIKEVNLTSVKQPVGKEDTRIVIINDIDTRYALDENLVYEAKLIDELIDKGRVSMGMVKVAPYGVECAAEMYLELAE